MNLVTRGLGKTHDNLVTNGLGFSGEAPPQPEPRRRGTTFIVPPTKKIIRPESIVNESVIGRPTLTKIIRVLSATTRNRFGRVDVFDPNEGVFEIILKLLDE